MRSRKLQDVDRISSVQRMQRKHVFKRCWGISGFDLSPLFARLQLACWELNLHLQCGLLGACRRQLHSVRCRTLHCVIGISRMHRMCRRHVFNNCRGLRGIDMPRLFARLQLA